MLRRIFVVVVALLVIVAVGTFAIAYRPAIDPLPPEPAQQFDEAVVAHGASLAAIGNCTSCHTVPGGKTFAGGLAIPTPFGTIHSTNITPDRDTGIGNWTEAAFRRALREGVSREGDHLYPAFPYDHFTHITDEDIGALYAYLMTREAVASEVPPNELQFPINIRPIVAGWKLLFFRQGQLAPVEGQTAEWHRGQYLAEGLGHCSACHTPRNNLGAEDPERHNAGASDIEGWYAYPINASSPAPVRWDVEQLTKYLQFGFSEAHGTARGPMAQVTANLGSAPAEDIRAIATYIASQMGDAAAAASEPPAADPLAIQSGDSQVAPIVVEASAGVGAAIYAGACSSCHDAERPQPLGGLDLRLSTAVHADNPQNLVNMVLYGLPAPEGEAGPIMPGYAGSIDAEQLVALLDYIRTTFSDQPAWANAREIVEDTLSGATEPIIYSTDGVRRVPLAVAPRTAS